MIKEELFGYCGLFGDRRSMKEAFDYFNDVLKATRNGPDKTALITAAFVVSNSLARASTNLANVLAQNIDRNIKLIDGERVDEITLYELLEGYTFPFEERCLLAQLNEIRTAHPALGAYDAMKHLDPATRMYFLMATPNKEKLSDAEGDVQGAETPQSA